MARALHILTVYHGPTRWDLVQRRYLQRYLRGKYRHWTSYPRRTRIPWSPTKVFFDGTHAASVANLFRAVARNMSLDDAVCLLDSDAFPVRTLAVEWLFHGLELYRFIAARRLRESRAHACFLVAPYKQFIEWEPLLGTFGHHSIQVTENHSSGICDPFHWLGGDGWLPLDCTHRLIEDIEQLFVIHGGLIYHHGGGSSRRVWDVSWDGPRRRKRNVRKLALDLFRKIRYAEDFWSLPNYQVEPMPWRKAQKVT